MNIRKYHYFYKITNLLNGKYYYGIHTTNDLDDGYMGSGKALKIAIKKYGVENFRKDILRFFPSLEELSDFEKLMVTEDLVNDPNCYNLVRGGYFLSEEDIEKLKSSIKGKQIGEKNSSYGTCWITKDNKSIKILKTELDKYTHDGWSKGRVITNKDKITDANKGRLWIWKDGRTKFVYSTDLNDYLNDGWVKGRSNPEKPEEIKPIKKNHIAVVDKDGNMLTVSNDDDRYLSGELVSYNKGKVSVVDKTGHKLFVRIDDPRYLCGELIPIQKKYKNFVVVKDKNGNTLKVEKTDPRYLNKELIPITSNRHRPIDERQKISKSKKKFKMTWVNNGCVHKYIKLEDLDHFLTSNKGWMRGRIKSKQNH